MESNIRALKSLVKMILSSNSKIREGSRICKDYDRSLSFYHKRHFIGDLNPNDQSFPDMSTD